MSWVSPHASVRAVAAVDYIAFRDDVADIAALAKLRLLLPTFFSESPKNGRLS